MNQHMRDLRPGGGEYPRDRGAGDAHPGGDGLLIESLAVNEADGLEFIHHELGPLEIAGRHAGGFEHRGERLAGYDSLSWRSGHGRLVMNLRS